MSDPFKRLERKVDHINSIVDKGPASAGQSIGRGLGSLLGNADLGGAAGDALSKWFGFGDYELKSNSLIKASTSGSMIPVFSKDGRRGIRVCEREYLGDVLSSATPNSFQNSSYRLNPADPRTFPWLSAIANQFEEYELNGLIFEYKTTSAMYNGTTQALGTVTMMTDYDPLDPAPTDLVTMQNADYSCSTVSSNNLQHGVECEPSERTVKLMYTEIVRPADSEVRWCDVGNFNIATSGVSAASVNLGQLWVSYDISFYKKQLSPGLGSATRDIQVTWTSSTGVTNLTPFGLTQTRTALGQIPLTFDNVTGDRFSLPSVATGTFMCVLSVFCNNLTNNTSPAVSYVKNCSAVAPGNPIFNGLTSFCVNNSRVIYVFGFTVTGENPIIQFTTPGLTITDVTNWSCSFRVVEVNSSVSWPSQTISYTDL